MSSTTLAELTDRCLQFRAERDWAQFHTPKELAISLVVESAELLELMQWKKGPQLQEHIDKNREAISDELGDVMHSILLLANDLGIDLTAATQRKLDKLGQKYPVEKARGKPRKYTELED